MATTRFTKAFAGICIFSLLVAQGCATTPDNTAPSSAELGTVGIVSIGLPPTPEALGPIGPSEEGRRGARRGILEGAEIGGWTGFVYGFGCLGLFFICSPVLALAGAVVGAAAGAAGGAIIGTVNALPTETAAELEAALMAALADRDLTAELAERVLAQDRAGEPAVVGLGTVEEPETDAPRDYIRFAASGVDTVLELSIALIGLTREERGDAPFSLLINANARLVRTSDNEVLWSNPKIVYLSPAADLSVWTAPGSDYLRTEIDSGVERLVQEIHSQVFSAT